MNFESTFDPDKRVEPMVADYDVIYTINDLGVDYNLHACKCVKTFFTFDNSKHWFRKESVNTITFDEEKCTLILTFDDGFRNVVKIKSQNQGLRVLEHFLKIIG